MNSKARSELLAAPSPTGETPPAAETAKESTRPLLSPPLSAHEEQMLYVYSPTLGRSYNIWKVAGEAEKKAEEGGVVDQGEAQLAYVRMPQALLTGITEWRSHGCPGHRAPLTRPGHRAPLTQSEDRAPLTRSGQTEFQSSDFSEYDAANTASAGNARADSDRSKAEAMPLLRSPVRSAAPVRKAPISSLPLPGIVPRTPGDTAPMSNYLARTSLFAPIRKGRRVMHDKQKLHSPEGLNVLYSGKQLDMADQDVYLTALRLAGGNKPGDRIVINRAAFLRMLGYKHNPGARDYKWLEESFYRISTGRVIIEAKHIKANLPLIGALLLDERSGDYYFTIPRETYALWAKHLYSYIDLEKRHALLRNVPLSKWLQSYAQSHTPGQHIISMDLLHQWCGYGGRLRDFRESLTGALDEITRVGILKSWSIAERGQGRQKKLMITWVRERTHRDDTAALEQAQQISPELGVEDVGEEMLHLRDPMDIHS